MERASGRGVTTTGHKLEELTGIGRASAEALAALDIASVEELASSDPVDLTSRLVALHESGGSKSNWATRADEWVATARSSMLVRRESRTDELSSFTVRFEVDVEEAEGTEIRNYRCLVYDEQGAGEEISFETDPTEWGQFILERSGLPIKLIDNVGIWASNEGDYDGRTVRIAPETDPDGDTKWKLHAELDPPHGSDVVVVLVADDGSPAHAGIAATDRSGTSSLPLPSLDPGEYRAFAWIKGTMPDGGYSKPVPGPLIRVRPVTAKADRGVL